MQSCICALEALAQLVLLLLRLRQGFCQAHAVVLHYGSNAIMLGLYSPLRKLEPKEAALLDPAGARLLELQIRLNFESQPYCWSQK